MRKSSLILLLAMAFVLATVVSGFSTTVIDGPCKELCDKYWGYNLYIDSTYECDTPTQANPNAVGCPPCPLFDYESALGYCGSNSGEYYYNAAGIILKVCDCPDVTFQVGVNYGIKLEIVSPASGVYFSNSNASGSAYANCMQTCGAGSPYIYVTPVGDTTNEAGFCPAPCDATAYAFAYESMSGSLFDVANNTDECCLDCIAPLSKAVQSTCQMPFMAAQSPYIMIDIPTLVWDPKVIADGDEVSIKVTITGEPGEEVCTTCNDLCSCIVKIGIFGCPTVAPAAECNLCFPYFTSLGATGWWSGFALTNSGSSAADVAVTFTADGTSVTVDIPVPANSVVVKSLGQLAELDALANAGAIYAQAVGTVPTADGGTTAASISGFAIMGDGYQAYGYLSKEGLCGCCSTCSQ
jgi:hypothetical protein